MRSSTHVFCQNNEMEFQQMNKYYINYNDQLPSYKEFYENVMKKNLVCKFNSKLTEKWLSRKEWIDYDDVNNNDNKKCLINFDYLIKNYGNLIVPVYNCNEKYYNSNPCTKMLFKDYIDYWKTSQNKNEILYLKDWHLAQNIQSDYFYEIPEYFQSDYLNEYCLETKQLDDDYRFVYMGPDKSHTPLHVDVFGSFSWSANIIGKKFWLIIPEHNIDELKKLNSDKQQLPHDLYELSNYKELMKKFDAFEIEQNIGEIIFIPSGYIHQVKNIGNTISINHNWFNACNFEKIYINLISSLNDVKNELNDIKCQNNDNNNELNELYDKILRIHFGMNRIDFLNILRFITKNRLSMQLNNNIKYKFCYINDIKCLKNIYEKILSNNNNNNNNNFQINDNDLNNFKLLNNLFNKL